ncbi:glycosyltransferase [Bacteroides fragilis]|nr:glycosyltransferase [Bacteroides fragilis]
MSITPAISIVMPTYNMGSYLFDSVPSILGQSFENFELIIVDDGSTDQTEEIIKSFTDLRIVYIYREHEYMDSMNAGIAAVRGKYIVRMDADDLMTEDRLKKQFDFMEVHPEVDICGGGMELFGDVTGRLYPLVEHRAIAASLLLQNTVVHPSVIMRKSSLDEYIAKRGFLYDKTFVFAEDYHLWTCLMMEGYRFANIREILVKHRVSKEAVTSKHSVEMQKATIATQKVYLKFAIQQIVKGERQYLPLIEEVGKLSSLQLLMPQDVVQLIYTLYNRLLTTSNQ